MIVAFFEILTFFPSVQSRRLLSLLNCEQYLVRKEFFFQTSQFSQVKFLDLSSWSRKHHFNFSSPVILADFRDSARPDAPMDPGNVDRVWLKRSQVCHLWSTLNLLVAYIQMST